jgi:3-methyladenine DNA glycosylase/8-oxoguanine DNA glycosylase
MSTLAAAAAPAVTVRVEIAPLDLRRSLLFQNVGTHDPTCAVGETFLRKSFHAQTGPCTVLLQRCEGGLSASVWGPGAEGIGAELARGLAQDDGYARFAETAPPVFQKLHRRNPGLRILRFPWLYDHLCSAVLQQRVRWVDAAKQFRILALRHGGKTAEGAALFPSAEILSRLPGWELESIGIDPKRTRALLTLAREWRTHPLKASMEPPELRKRLLRLRGIGPWTVETALGFGAGDPDALPLADLYLPHLVCRALAGEERGTDERMVELLEPVRGHRFRAIRLLHTLGSK